jgi:diguanylate cyclase (GGDEF)-like protein
VVLVMLLGSAFVLFRSVGTERQLRRLVALDPLTNLPNRRTFTELLEKEVAVATTTGTPLGLMFIDLDNFKYVNDSLGHEVGDMLLQQVALRLSSSVRASDVVCRIGGDEFTVVLPNLGSMEDAEAIASRILESLGKPLRVGENSLSTSASVGIAVCPWDASSLTHLVRCADMAVYRAKAQGKSCAARYSPDLLHAAQSRNQLVQELRTALAGDDQLFLVYQPKIQLESGEVSGFEALIRWQHPQRGLVMPSDFIAAAEESELIIKLGDYVVNQAVAQIRAWCDQGYGWRKVAVNVSARQLRGGHVASTIQDALLRHGVPGQYLQIELTETMLATEEDFAAKTLARLQMLGVAIAVDDFGTGYSSLQSLQQLDVDCIKVDRSFVAGIGVNKDSMEIVRTVVNLAHNLELRVVAEGIETLDQYKYLMELGCDEGQGYFFARPLVASEAIQYSTTVALFTPLAA